MTSPNHTNVRFGLATQHDARSPLPRLHEASSARWGRLAGAQADIAGELTNAAEWSRHSHRTVIRNNNNNNNNNLHFDITVAWRDEDARLRGLAVTSATNSVVPHNGTRPF